MSFSDKYDLEEIAYGTTGWNAIVWANFQLIDAGLDSRIGPLTAGEAIAQYEAVFVHTDGKVYRARADGTHQPCRGLAVEAAAADETLRVQREGEMTNVSWSWATKGAAVYLSPGVWGGLTQLEPGANIQTIGYALSATSIVIERGDVASGSVVTTTTTTTTTAP